LLDLQGTVNVHKTGVGILEGSLCCKFIPI